MHARATHCQLRADAACVDRRHTHSAPVLLALQPVMDANVAAVPWEQLPARLVADTGAALRWLTGQQEYEPPPAPLQRRALDVPPAPRPPPKPPGSSVRSGRSSRSRERRRRSPDSRA
jgi:hypothetical protein